MFESVNAVGFFENFWGYIPYWETNEREWVLPHVKFLKRINQLKNYSSNTNNI